MLLTFFRELLGVWDGVDRREAILSTLAYVPLMDWKGNSVRPGVAYQVR
jgi:hypothetical protein